MKNSEHKIVVSAMANQIKELKDEIVRQRARYRSLSRSQTELRRNLRDKHHALLVQKTRVAELNARLDEIEASIGSQMREAQDGH